MKVWAASASVISLSLAYFGVACSSEPPNDNQFTGGTTSTGGGGAGTTAGTNSTAGTMSMAGTTPVAGTSTGGTGTQGGSDAGGSGGTGTAGGTGGSTAGGTGGGACPPGVDGHCKAGFDYPKVDGYTLALVEEFDEPINLNTDPIWTWSDGAPADGQTSFREEAIKFEGGYMTLTADKPAGCAANQNSCIAPRKSYGEAQAPATQADLGPMGVYSGELRSKYNNYRYGRYEVKLQPPNQPMGNFLSTMFIFRTPKNVQWNEIDIELEPWHGANMVNGNAVNFTGPGNAPVGYPNDPGRNDAFEVAGPGQFDKFAEHVYAFNWTPGKIDWFVDGQMIHTFSGEAQNMVASQSAKIMMNLWVFASSAAFGDPTKNTFPMVAKYDWFRFYKLNTETMYPCKPTPTCLPDADKTASSQNNPKEMMYGK
jgi:hypothetical protein